MHGDLSPYVVPLGAFAVGIVAIVSGAFSQAHTAKAEGRSAHGDGGAWNERRRYR